MRRFGLKLSIYSCLTLNKLKTRLQSISASGLGVVCKLYLQVQMIKLLKIRKLQTLLNRMIDLMPQSYSKYLLKHQSQAIALGPSLKPWPRPLVSSLASGFSLRLQPQLLVSCLMMLHTLRFYQLTVSRIVQVYWSNIKN